MRLYFWGNLFFETHQCLFNFIGNIDTSLLGLLTAHSPLLIAKKTFAFCHLSLLFFLPLSFTNFYQMKKVLLIVFTLISINLFSQINVKEGSFRKIDGYVMLDKKEHLDDNDNPMALIKITTENISAEQRAKFYFNGNLETFFDKQLQEDGQLYLYISAVAPFMEIIHPEYGKTECHFLFDLCDFCGYEMVVQYVPLVASDNESVKPQNNFLTITCDQDNAAVYIDDEYVGDKDGFKSLPIGSTHTWRIECDLYHAESGSVTITEGQLVIDKTLRPAFGFLNVKSTPENGAIVYVNNKRVGETPYTSERLASGSYKVRVVKEMYKTSEQTFVVNDGKTTNAVLNMIANFVNVTINTDSQSDIYVDEELKGKGKWSGRLSEGAHLVEARKMSHTSTFKEVNLTAGMTEVINVESPKPIYGYLEISSDPILADIYIDGKHSGQTPKVIYDLLVGEHELKLTKQGCAELKKNIAITEGETLVLNEKLQTGKEITITTDQYGDKIYVDGNYLGISPITSTLSYGNHEIKVERNGKTVSKNINVVQGGESKVELKFNEHNGHKYIDLGLSVKWATCNVGATTPEEYGDYFTWGETSTKAEYNSDNCATCGLSKSELQSQGYIDSEDKLTAQYDAATAIWGGNWRMPTEAEYNELLKNCTWTWTTQEGVNGYKVTGPSGASIFLPAAGYRDGSSLNKAGSGGIYWSSTPYGVYPLFLSFASFNRSMYYGSNRYVGHSVRSVLE